MAPIPSAARTGRSSTKISPSVLRGPDRTPRDSGQWGLAAALPRRGAERHRVRLLLHELSQPSAHRRGAHRHGLEAGFSRSSLRPSAVSESRRRRIPLPAWKSCRAAVTAEVTLSGHAVVTECLGRSSKPDAMPWLPASSGKRRKLIETKVARKSRAGSPESPAPLAIDRYAEGRALLPRVSRGHPALRGQLQHRARGFRLGAPGRVLVPSATRRCSSSGAGGARGRPPPDRHRIDHWGVSGCPSASCARRYRGRLHPRTAACKRHPRDRRPGPRR